MNGKCMHVGVPHHLISYISIINQHLMPSIIELGRGEDMIEERLSIMEMMQIHL
jgi:hypothetical protein